MAHYKIQLPDWEQELISKLQACKNLKEMFLHLSKEVTQAKMDEWTQAAGIRPNQI